MALFKEIEKNNEIYDRIKNFFSIQDLLIGNLEYGNNIPVIFIRFKDLGCLEKQWKEFNSYITAEYLIKLQNDFSKWNTYVFYIAEKTVTKALKYEIENNKFSSRKIVIESEKLDVDSAVIEGVISEYIINDNIKFDVESEDVDEFVKNEKIDEAIRVVYSKSDSIKENNLKKILDKIEKMHQDEN
ncbi:MAG TPA: ABC-three component system middle component 1 [Flavobacterium sp.]|uniref:ABC-three component system middle component 1 n=1 Tax=Flavobacterium sp. TaxID=239 RepID=UPI002ED1A96F